MREQPQALLCPCRATLRPSMLNWEHPSMMGLSPCPGIGHATISPTLAMPIPCSVWIGEALVTMPPCVVLSPSRTMASAMLQPESGASGLPAIFYIFNVLVHFLAKCPGRIAGAVANPMPDFDSGVTCVLGSVAKGFCAFPGKIH